MLVSSDGKKLTGNIGSLFYIIGVPADTTECCKPAGRPAATVPYGVYALQTWHTLDSSVTDHSGMRPWAECRSRVPINGAVIAVVQRCQNKRNPERPRLYPGSRVAAVSRRVRSGHADGGE